MSEDYDYDPNGSAKALNRVADALFQCAKEQRRQSKVAETALELQKEMIAMQQLNLNVTKALEEQLMMAQGENNAQSSN